MEVFIRKHKDKRLKHSFPGEKEIEGIEKYPHGAKAMFASIKKASSSSGEHEDKRWSFAKEITEVFDLSVKHSFPEEEEIKLFLSEDGQPHDFECWNVLTIWTKLQKNPELRRQKYSHIKVPKDIGEEIMNDLLKLAGDKIQKPSICDVGFVAFPFSRRWLANSIHKMLKDGIDTWTPILPVGRVMVDFPSLEEEIDLGWFRQHAIANTITRMLCYCKVDVAFWPSYKDEFMTLCPPQMKREWGESIIIKQREFDVVINVEEKPPFILANGDYVTFERDMKKLWMGIHEIKADWIVYLTPVRQQEYIEMCFTAAKLEGWMECGKGNWNPRIGNEYPILTYAGYRTYSTEELRILSQQLTNFDLVAVAEDAQLLGYNDEAVLTCILMYTCLNNHRLADCTFNYDEMVKNEGNTFVYLLHTRAEVHRITNNYRKDINELKKASDLILEKSEGWEESKERMLEFHLLKFTDVLAQSSLFVLPHVMCKYLYDLCETFKSYKDFVLTTKSFAETSRLLLCEATEVVMEKCFRLLGITPEVANTANLPMLQEAIRRRSTSRSFANLPTMAGREQMDRARLDKYFVDRFITPCSVSDIRDPSRNSRFEVFSIVPSITRDTTVNEGYLFGLISVADKYGLIASDGAYPLCDPDLHYVLLFRHSWCDPVNIDGHHARIVYLGNPSSHRSVPFSSFVELNMELYVSTETKDDCFQLCDHVIALDLKNFWHQKTYVKSGDFTIEGEDGSITMYYILLKDAVDAALEVSFKMKTEREVHGHIFAYYGDEFSYYRTSEKNYYKALLYSSYPPIVGLIPIPVLNRSGPILLKRSVLAVPKNASLIIDAYFEDPETKDIILTRCCNLKTPTKEGSSEFTTIMHGTDCSLELKVVWK